MGQANERRKAALLDDARGRLQPGESIEAAVHGMVFGGPRVTGSASVLSELGPSRGLGVVLATDRRVIGFVLKVFGGHWSQTIDYPEVDSVSGTDKKLVVASAASQIAVSCPAKERGAIPEARRVVDAGRARSRSQVGSVADEIEQLGRLAAEGLITADEFDRAKALFLGKPEPQQKDAMELLRNLHGLYRGGVLSESEFNMKKWEILERS